MARHRSFHYSARPRVNPMLQVRMPRSSGDGATAESKDECEQLRIDLVGAGAYEVEHRGEQQIVRSATCPAHAGPRRGWSETG